MHHSISFPFLLQLRSHLAIYETKQDADHQPLKEKTTARFVNGKTTVRFVKGKTTARSVKEKTMLYLLKGRQIPKICKTNIQLLEKRRQLLKVCIGLFKKI